MGWILCQEDPLEKEMTPTCVFLPGESHAQRSLAGYKFKAVILSVFSTQQSLQSLQFSCAQFILLMLTDLLFFISHKVKNKHSNPF